MECIEKDDWENGLHLLVGLRQHLQKRKLQELAGTVTKEDDEGLLLYTVSHHKPAWMQMLLWVCWNMCGRRKWRVANALPDEFAQNDTLLDAQEDQTELFALRL